MNFQSCIFTLHLLNQRLCKNHLNPVKKCTFNKPLMIISGWKGRYVQVRDFRLGRFFRPLGLQVYCQRLFLRGLIWHPDLHSQSAQWLRALVCALGRSTSSQSFFHWSQTVRTFVWQSRRDSCGGKCPLGRRHSLHSGVSRRVQQILHSHLQ